MAKAGTREEFRYNPLDFEPDVAVGVMLPFNGNALGRSDIQHYASGSRSGDGVFALSFSTEQQAISNLKNLLLTRKGERFMQPDFGTRIFDSLFEPNTKELEENLEIVINEDIEFWLPYIIIDQIAIDRAVDQHILDINLRFRVTENGANQVIKILVDQDGIQLNNSIL
tara:strand:+ start:337 stop:843 length:507 start_codon:yes stop_codon:yes gene_type:complete